MHIPLAEYRQDGSADQGQHLAGDAAGEEIGFGVGADQEGMFADDNLGIAIAAGGDLVAGFEGVADGRGLAVDF